MATMGKAIKDAGIAIPANKRIWQWLKDQNKAHTGAEVSKALNIKSSVSSSMLSQMQERKMVLGEKRFSTHLGRTITYYSAIGKTFAVLPVPKKPSNEISEIIDVTPKQSKSDTLLDNLSVVDAYDLYQRLHAMFNPKEK